MKIAFYTNMVLTYGGGLDKYYIEITKGLSQRYPDLQIDIITSDKKLARKIQFLYGIYFGHFVSRKTLENESTEDVKAKLGPRVTYRQASNFKKLRNMLQEYDVIYSKNEVLEAFILKRLTGYKRLPPVIFGCHTAIDYPIANSFRSKLHNYLYQGWVYKHLASGVQSFHVLNPSDAGVLRKSFPEKQVEYIVNPFDFDSYTQQAAQEKFSFAFDKNKINIFWVGRLSEQKGVTDFLEIIDHINKDHADKVNWNIAGTGSEKGAVLEGVKRHSNVNYLGYVEAKYMPSIYQQNNLFLSTSKWEGFPYNILEAQCFGLPVVAFDIPGCQEIIDSGANGYLAKDKQELIKRLEELISGKKLEADIKVYIRKKFNQEDIYNELRELFLDAQV